MTYAESLIDIAIGNTREAPKIPTITIPNPTQVPIFVNLISVTADSFFSVYGSARIDVGEEQVVLIKSGKFQFTESKQFPLKNVKLARHGEIKIYVWNEKTDDKVKLTVDIAVSEDATVLLSNFQSSDQNKIRREVSSNFVDSQTQFQIEALDNIRNSIENQNITVDNADILTKLQNVIDGLPASPDNSDIITKLNEVKISIAIEDTGLRDKLDLVINAVENQVVNLNDVNIVSGLNSILAGLPSSPDNSDVIRKLQNLIDSLPDSPDNTDVITKLNEVKSSIDTEDVGLRNKLDNVITAINEQELTADNTDITTKLQNVIDALPDSPDNVNLLAKLTDLKNAVDTENTNLGNKLTDIKNSVENQVVNLNDVNIVSGLNSILAGLPSSPDNTDVIRKLQNLIDSLPDSPDNTDVITKLNEVKSSIDTEDVGLRNKLDNVITAINEQELTADNTDITTKLQNVIDALPDSPDNVNLLAKLTDLKNAVDTENTNLGNKLTAVKNSVDNVSISNDTIPKAIHDINIELTSSIPPTPIYNLALTVVKSALIGLRDGFDIDELKNVISIMNANLQIIRDNNNALGLFLDSLKINLDVISKSPALTQSDNNLLFEKRAYYNETVVKLVNMKGSRNLICLIAGSTVIAPSRYFLSSWGYTQFPIVHGSTFGLSPISAIGIDFMNSRSKIMFFNVDSNTTSFRDRRGRVIATNSFALTLDVSDDRNFMDSTTMLDVARVSGTESIDQRNSNNRGTFTRFTPKTLMFRTLKRYARLRGTVTRGRVGGDSFTNNINLDVSPNNSMTTGGTSQLSFEVSDGLGDWFEHISASEINAVTHGQKVRVEFGEAVSGHIVPSSQTLFRAKLIVTGGIETSVSIIRVA